MAVALGFTLAASADAADLKNDDCSHTTVTTAASPGGAWIAEVDEAVCDGGGMATAIVASVRVVAAGGDPATDVLGVDTGGHESERPLLAWTSPVMLQVIVPNLSLLKVLTRRVGPVSIDVRFNPPDPSARAAWLRSLGLPAE